jgi:adenylate cyclase
MARRTPEEALRGWLTGEHPGHARSRKVFSRLPSSPHCKLCAAPFAGVGGAVLGPLGFARYPGNPSICGKCINSLNKVGVYGVEIPVSLLFADIRGSTGLAEAMSPTEFRDYLDRFYRIASQAILGSNGVVDKFVGDEAIGLFFKGVSGAEHTSAAVRAAKSLLQEAGRDSATPMGAIPVGIAVHTGEAYVGSTGSNSVVNDFTALGDVVNITARLSSEAAAGELLISEEAISAADIGATPGNARTIGVRGRTDPIVVYSI